jgi:hypothetical protein
MKMALIEPKISKLCILEDNSKGTTFLLGRSSNSQ